jgi:hypothetical protein
MIWIAALVLAQGEGLAGLQKGSLVFDYSDGSRKYETFYEIAQVPPDELANLDRYLDRHGVRSARSLELPGFMGGYAMESVGERKEFAKARRLVLQHARSHGYLRFVLKHED